MALTPTFEKYVDDVTSGAIDALIDQGQQGATSHPEPSPPVTG